MKEKISQEGQSIGWFKLAQLVSRGEREKALALYKLLSYSFDDKAFALQVEGDLLWAFEDEGAIMSYQKSAFLYKKEHRHASAMAIYEHLISLDPTNYEFLSSLIEVYASLSWQERLHERMDLLLQHFNENKVTKEQVLRVIKIVTEQLLKNNYNKALTKFKTFLAQKNKLILKNASEFF